MPTAVYRLYDTAGQLLYVGITGNVEQRWKEHSEDKFWWHLVAQKQVTWHDTRAEAATKEQEAIASENPVHNRTWPNGRPREGRRMSDPFVAGVHADLRRAIQEGRYPEGSELPTPEALASEYGVSVTSIESALWRLHGERMVKQGPVRRPRGAPRVRPFLVADFQRNV